MLNKETRKQYQLYKANVHDLTYTSDWTSFKDYSLSLLISTNFTSKQKSQKSQVSLLARLSQSEIESQSQLDDMSDDNQNPFDEGDAKILSYQADSNYGLFKFRVLKMGDAS